MRFQKVGSFFIISLWALWAHATTFTVNSTLDAPDAVPGDGLCESAGGECTLRAAVMEANELEGADSIEVPAGTYALNLVSTNRFEQDPSVGDLEITDDVSIVGAGDKTIVDASALNDRVMSILGSGPEPLQVEMAKLVLTGGATDLGGGCVFQRGRGTMTLRSVVVKECEARLGGGGILSRGGEDGLVLVDTVISNNHALYGGGIASVNNALRMVRSRVDGNGAKGSQPSSPGFGGGIYAVRGSLHALDSTISNNVSARLGGGMLALASALGLERTSVNGNQASNPTAQPDSSRGTGGGIWMALTRLDVANSTISGNSAVYRAGGIFSALFDNVRIAFSTLSNNSHGSTNEGAGITMAFLNRRDNTFKGVIVAGNLADGIESNCSMVFPAVSQGYNLDGDGSCVDPHATDILFVDPLLKPLDNYGGFSPTHALLPDSPAIDLVPTEDCVLSIDNDLDSMIDEDPIDGSDNDGDGDVDEDPPEVVDVDQRGVNRPAGEGCDAGAVEGEGTVEGVINDLIADIREWIADGQIPYSRGRNLIAELQVALWFLGYEGGEQLAVVRLQIFIVMVEGMIEREEIAEELGNELLMRAHSIKDMLNRMGS